MKFIKKYIGDRHFYRIVMLVAIPIILQNFITNFVSMLDNVMVGTIGTEQMSGVSIVNQLIFIFNLTVFGAISGAGIFTAQFHGKGNTDGVRATFRLKLVICVALAVAAMVIFLLFGESLIGLYLHDGSYECDLTLAMNYAKQYLAIAIFGLIPYALTQAYAGTLRETGETVVPMVLSFVAVLTNCLFNYLLIFGKLGFPEMGVRGAAVATVISRVVECSAAVVYGIIFRKKHLFLCGAFRSFRIPGALLRDILRRGTPLLVNECFWAVGRSLLNVSYSYHGLDVVAGVSISATILDMFNIVCMAFGTSVGIIVGRQLGAGKNDEAVDTDRKLIAFSVAVSVVMAVLVFTVGSLIPQVYNTTQASREHAVFFIRVGACFMPFSAFTHAAYFTLRCGGKTLVTFFFDSVFVCLISVPLAFLLCFATNLPITVCYIAVQATEMIKCVIGAILLRRRMWVNNIVTKPEEKLQGAS